MTTRAHYEMLYRLSRDGKISSTQSLSWLRNHLREAYYAIVYDTTAKEYVALKKRDFYVEKKRDIGNLVTCTISSLL